MWILYIFVTWVNFIKHFTVVIYKHSKWVEAFFFKWLPNCLFNVIGLIPFWEMESSVLSAKLTSSTK
jgi:hypothetical protein